MTRTLMVLSCLVAIVAMAAPPTAWTPKIAFQLEDAGVEQTLTWISGWSYAITEAGHSNFVDGAKGRVCLSPSESVESRTLIGALNAQFQGQRITSEQASAALWKVAQSAYRCGKRT